MVLIPAAALEDAESNSCKSNRSSSKRASIDNEFKASSIKFYEHSGLAVAQFMKKHTSSTKHNKCLFKGASGWRNPNRKSIALNMASDAKCKKCKCSASGANVRKSSHAITKNDVCKHVAEHRKKGRKVSMNFVRITA